MTDHQLAPQGEVPQKLDILATINDFLTVGSKLSFVGGFLALVWYCVTEGVAFPINSLSQAVSTFAVAFVLVLLLGMMAVYSYLVIQPALFIHSGFRRRKNGERFWGADVGDRLSVVNLTFAPVGIVYRFDV